MEWHGLTRRQVLAGAGAGAVYLAAGYGWRPGIARAATAAPAGIHLEYGSDPTTEMTVSWRTPVGAGHPTLRLGTPDGGIEHSVVPETVTIVDAEPDLASAKSLYPVSEYQHARLTGLTPGQTYVYECVHDGAEAVAGTLETRSAGRGAFSFTAFGDQGTGYTQDVVAGPFGAYVVPQVEALAPAFHLHLGDLAYSNLQAPTQRGPAWDRFVDNLARSAASRPWMPAVGNHEIDGGMGPQGYGNYLGRFALPSNGSSAYAGHWYAFTVAGVRVIVTDANDVAYQNAGIDAYIHGYSGGAQLAWLESELSAARASREIDWVVCVVHQLVASSSAAGNGCDLGIRQTFRPLFDRYEVDLVLSGHDHDYERSHALRGVVPGSATLTPAVADASLEVIDSTRGTVYMVLGGGGVEDVSNVYGSNHTTGQPQATVITSEKDSTTEPALWSAVREPLYPYSFAQFSVDPGTGPGAITRIRVNALQTAVPSVSGAPGKVLDSFTLQRPRSDTPVVHPRTHKHAAKHHKQTGEHHRG